MQQFDEKYYLYCPPPMKENLIQDLLKYKLDSDVKLEDISQETEPLYLDKRQNKTKGCIEIDGEFYEFTHHQMIDPERSLDYQEFSQSLIFNGNPMPEIFIDQNPFEVGLYNMIFLEKGCFLGQEPLSRIYHRGRIRKQLYLLEIENKPENSILTIAQKEVGEILQYANNKGYTRAVAFLKSSIHDPKMIKFDQPGIKILKRIGSYPETQR